MGQCNSVDCADSCLVLTIRYLCLKYCPCCTRDYTRKLRREVEKEEKRIKMLDEQDDVSDDNTSDAVPPSVVPVKHTNVNK